jgi:ABC-type lipoprotein release transport system permease subunit
VLLGRPDLELISDPEEINADVLIDWADGVDVQEANAELSEATGTEVFEPRLPSDVNNLREVKALPRALALFLAVLAILAAVHALVVLGVLVVLNATAVIPGRIARRVSPAEVLRSG